MWLFEFALVLTSARAETRREAHRTCARIVTDRVRSVARAAVTRAASMARGCDARRVPSAASHTLDTKHTSIRGFITALIKPIL